MPKITVHLPEDVVEAHGGIDGTAKALMARFLALPDYKAGDRCVVLTAAHRRRLEEVLGQPIDSPDSLVLAATRLAVIHLGEIRRQLSPSEAARVEAYAMAHGLTPQQAAEQLLNPLIDQWLEAV